jgi:hypothetical protein
MDWILMSRVICLLATGVCMYITGHARGYAKRADEITAEDMEYREKYEGLLAKYESMIDKVLEDENA